MKRIFVFLLISVLAFSLMAREKDPQPTEAPTTSTSEAPSEVPSEVPTESPTAKPSTLEDRFEEYPKLVNADGFNGLGYYNSIDDLSVRQVFDWAIAHVPHCEFVADEAYKYSYKITELDAFTEKYLGRTYDYLPITNEDLVLDPESDTLTVIYHGAYGDMPVRAVYESYTQVDDTHFEITYHTGGSTSENNQTSYWKVTKKISVELVDGNYIITAHKEATKTEISIEEYYAWYVN